MNNREKALQILRKYENRPTGYDEDEIINGMIEFSESQSKLKNNGDLGDVVDQRELLISFMEFRDKIYWGENEFTESKDIIELWLKRNK